MTIAKSLINAILFNLRIVPKTLSEMFLNIYLDARNVNKVICHP